MPCRCAAARIGAAAYRARRDAPTVKDQRRTTTRHATFARLAVAGSHGRVRPRGGLARNTAVPNS
jgi:hypothetical protein